MSGRSLGVGVRPCPFCRTAVPDGAVVCTGCGAMEGYVSPGRTRERHIRWIAAAVLFWLSLPVFFGARSMNVGVWISILLAIVFLLIGWRQLQRGPKWFPR